MSESCSRVIRNPPNRLQEDVDIEENIVYHTTPEHLIIESQWADCAATFERFYGVCNENAQHALGKRAEPGCAITMSSEMLKRHFAPQGAKTVLITAVTGEGRQVGHCFVSQWAHGHDRVWWITQFVVHPKYRNQRRATRMLQVLALCYDIGENPQQKDFVGILSPHPFTICAVLRVFGRGIESLPSKPDWERRPFEYTHAPLRGSICASIMEASPVSCVRTADIRPNSLSAYTGLRIDNTAPEQALHGIRYAMNKQIRAPWQWLFGDLHEGCEYLCILEYRFDPEYDMRPRFCDPGSGTKIASSFEFDDYAQLNEYMIHNSRSCSMESNLARGLSSSEVVSIDNRLNRAEDALIQDSKLIADIMDAKRVPDAIRPLFSTGEWDETILQHRVVPEYAVTWLDFKHFAKEIYCHDGDALFRLHMLQVVHYEVLIEECARLRQESDARRKHDSITVDGSVEM